MRKAFEIGGVLAAAVLIAFGIAALVMGVRGQNTVNSSLKQEQITGTPDMTPAGIAPEIKAVRTAQAQLAAKFKAAGLPFTPTKVSAPTSSVSPAEDSRAQTVGCRSCRSCRSCRLCRSSRERLELLLAAGSR